MIDPTTEQPHTTLDILTRAIVDLEEVMVARYFVSAEVQFATVSETKTLVLTYKKRGNERGLWIFTPCLLPTKEGGDWIRLFQASVAIRIAAIHSLDDLVAKLEQTQKAANDSALAATLKVLEITARLKEQK